MFGKKQTEKLMHNLKENDLDYLLLINLDLPQLDPNFYYFTGLDGYEHSIVLLGENPSVYVPGFEVARAEKESSVESINRTKKGLTKELGKLLKGKKVGINGDFMPFNFYKKLKKKGVKMTDFSDEIKELRVIKNKKEIEYIQKAAKVSKEVLKEVDTSKSEIEIAADLMYKYFQNGMKPGYDPIVAFDADSTVPHFVPTNAKSGKSLLIDSGAAFKNYCSDISRTFILEENDEIRKIYDIVEEAQKLAIDMIEPGVKASEIDKEVQDFLKEKGYSCPHSVGHGIGLVVHEKPYISVKSKEVLKEGMVFTVEPGIYLKNKFGVRIEDDVLVTKKGCEVL